MSQDAQTTEKLVTKHFTEVLGWTKMPQRSPFDLMTPEGIMVELKATQKSRNKTSGLFKVPFGTYQTQVDFFRANPTAVFMIADSSGDRDIYTAAEYLQMCDQHARVQLQVSMPVTSGIIPTGRA